MSRARPIAGQWFDQAKNSNKATPEQLELLATVEEADLEDYLEADLTQADIIARLREAMGQTIPDEVLLRRQKWRDARKRNSACRICGRKGDSTKHHFTNRWILKQLDGYQKHWADRSKNCIPLCIECHRDVHSRANGSHSIAPYLKDEEKALAERAINALFEQKPHLFRLIIKGDDSVYETRLLRDWTENKFKTGG